MTAPSQHDSQSTRIGKKLLDQFRDALSARHHSYRTEQSCMDLCKRFIIYHNQRDPAQPGFMRNVSAFRLPHDHRIGPQEQVVFIQKRTWITIQVRSSLSIRERLYLTESSRKVLRPVHTDRFPRSPRQRYRQEHRYRIGKARHFRRRSSRSPSNRCFHAGWWHVPAPAHARFHGV